MKFSIRDLLLVTVIVALVVGWWVDHRALAAISDFRQRKFVALEHLIRQAGHDVEYEGDMPMQVKMFMHLREVPECQTIAPKLSKP